MKDRQLVVICFLGTTLIIGMTSLGLAGIKGQPIDVSVSGAVMAMLGSFGTYLVSGKNTPPPSGGGGGGGTGQ